MGYYKFLKHNNVVSNKSNSENYNATNKIMKFENSSF